MTRWLRGFWGGVVATGPMTLFMMWSFAALKPKQKSALPPDTLAFQTAKQLVNPSDVSASTMSSLSLSSHFAYGGAAGTVYSLLRTKRVQSPALAGALFGVSVWLASYQGWIPLFNLRPPAERMPLSRNAVMVAAHLVWGASLGLGEDLLRQIHRRSGETVH